MSQFELQHVTKRFSDTEAPETVLLDINLQINPGEFLCLMGPSGGGKSTLLRIMAGLETASRGYVVGRPDNIGFVFQAFGLMPWLTVEQNIAYGLKMASVAKSARTHKVNELISLMGLHGLQDNFPRQLSGGQKQRVGIARALAIDPEILFLDEAFSALDTTTAKDLRADLLKIWHERKVTVVMVTHSPEEAAMLADRIVVLSAKPGQVEHEIINTLPRPRRERSALFFKLVDRLERFIR